MPEIQIMSRVTTPRQILNPRDIEFGRTFAPDWFVMEYQDGAWRNPRIEEVRPLALHPAAVALHYAQSAFEGLKAYLHADGRVVLFRPDMNARRMNKSAERLSMPPIDEELFITALSRLTEQERFYIPPAPGSLYLRPVMFGTEPCIGVRSSSEFIFYVLALPTGSYFREVSRGTGMVDVLVSESVARAAKGGTGHVKAAGNYAVTLQVIMEARKKGCAQVLFLDAAERTRVEEMGGMNVFFVRDGTLITPPLTNTILNGITRDSILRVAPDLGIPVREEVIDINDVVREIESGRITEAIACGTAAVLTGIRSLQFEDGRVVRLPGNAAGPVTSRVYDRLVGIQYGDDPDPYGWITEVCRVEAGVSR
ncbi:MAG TPA: branched-chain amino acid aminotransferase [Bryobacteraceae bacterium]|nr:branched-chain amino acid aminotransferase [Bryobacteraceae bacterium]